LDISLFAYEIYIAIYLHIFRRFSVRVYRIEWYRMGQYVKHLDNRLAWLFIALKLWPKTISATEKLKEKWGKWKRFCCFWISVVFLKCFDFIFFGFSCVFFELDILQLNCLVFSHFCVLFLFFRACFCFVWISLNY